MNYIIRFIGLIIVLIGIAHIAYPLIFKRIIEFIKQKNRIYYIASIRLVLGAVFLLGARGSRIPWVIVVFGILIILKGLAIFILGPAKIKSQCEVWQNKSNLVIRALALAALVLGVIIGYSA